MEEAKKERQERSAGSLGKARTGPPCKNLVLIAFQMKDGVTAKKIWRSSASVSSTRIRQLSL